MLFDKEANFIKAGKGFETEGGRMCYLAFVILIDGA